MPLYACTFGASHPGRDCYLEVEAHDPIAANEMMRDAFGERWSMTYPLGDYERSEWRAQWCLGRLVTDARGFTRWTVPATPSPSP